MHIAHVHCTSVADQVHQKISTDTSWKVITCSVVDFIVAFFSAFSSRIFSASFVWDFRMSRDFVDQKFGIFHLLNATGLLSPNLSTIKSPGSTKFHDIIQLRTPKDHPKDKSLRPRYMASFTERPFFLFDIFCLYLHLCSQRHHAPR